MKLGSIFLTAAMVMTVLPVSSLAESCYCLYDCDNYAQCGLYSEQPHSYYELCPDSSCGIEETNDETAKETDTVEKTCETNSDCLAEETDDGIDYLTPGTCTEYTCENEICTIKQEFGLPRIDTCYGAMLSESYTDGVSCKYVSRSCANECFKRGYENGNCYDSEDEEAYCYCYDDDEPSTPTGYSDSTDTYGYKRTIALVSGWNLISNPFSDTYGVNSNCVVTASIYGYDDGLKPAAGSLRDLEGGKAYLVKVSDDCEMKLGSDKVVNSITLDAGWNMIGTIGNAAMTKTFVETHCDLGSSIYGYSTETGKLKSITSLSPGIGYLVKADYSCTISK